MRSKFLEVDQVRRTVFALPFAAGAVYLFGRSGRSDAKFDVREVLLEEAKALITAGALVLDVRERVAYEIRHITGALLAPVSSLAAAIPASLEAVRAMPLVVYCGDGATLGPRGTHILNKAGFAGAVNLKPGIQGWAAAGLPIEQGPGKQA